MSRQLPVRRWADLAHCWPTEARHSGMHHNTIVCKSEEEVVAHSLGKGLEKKVSSVSGAGKFFYLGSGWV